MGGGHGWRGNIGNGGVGMWIVGVFGEVQGTVGQNVLVMSKRVVVAGVWVGML